VKLWNFLAVLVLASIMFVGCGDGEQVTTLKKDRDEVIATATAQAAKVQNDMKRVADESNDLNLKVQDLRNAVERQQEAVNDLNFSVRLLNDTLNQKKTELEARDKAAASEGNPLLTGFIVIVVVLVVVGLLFMLFRSKPVEEDDEDLYADDDEFELGDDADDFDKKGGDGSSDKD